MTISANTGNLIEGDLLSSTEESELLGRRPPMATLSAAELNYLVFRYLHESGFTHSAFTLGYEAGINKSPIDGNLVPPGALITFVQKGLLYIELEANNESDGDEDFSFLQPLDLITKDTHELQRIIKEKKESIRKEKNKSKEKHKEYDQEPERGRAREREKERQEREKEAEKERERAEKEKDKVKLEQPFPDSAKDRDDRTKDKSEGDAVSGGIKMETAVSSPALCEIPSSDVTILEGHASEVFACAWCPTGSIIASGSGDSTARIWTIPDGPGSSTVQNGLQKPLVLKHYKGKTIEKCKDVTTLDWNFDGTLLATGSYDGMARIWTRDGELRNTLNKHKGPVFSLKWNRKGDYLLSGSVDKTSIVWDVKTGEWKQHFEFHTAPTLDVDWRNNNSFATCSTDYMIHVCRIGENSPVKTFAGHKGEVNAIKWDPSGTLLASCSDDITAKIWSIKQDKCLHDLKEHQMEIYTIRWSPTGPGTANPNQQLVLASASFDSSIKIWDVELGTVLQTFNGHSQAVYSIAFSPNGEYLASGSLDKYIHVWSMKEGKIVKTYKGDGGIFEVCWNKEGDKIAGCFSNNTVCVLNFRM